MSPQLCASPRVTSLNPHAPQTRSGTRHAVASGRHGSRSESTPRRFFSARPQQYVRPSVPVAHVCSSPALTPTYVSAPVGPSGSSLSQPPVSTATDATTTELQNDILISATFP